jgi:hypothetical protein
MTPEPLTLERLTEWYPSSTLQPDHVPLVEEACQVFGITSFDPRLRPREVIGLKGYGSLEHFEPLWVRFVTAGGLKLTWPLNPDSEEILRPIFGCLRTRWNSVTKMEERMILPLPADLRLPPQCRTGLVPASTGRVVR